jgi:DNA repair protein RadC
MKTNSIKTWNEEERPREKLMLLGAAALTDTELLAILLGSGTRRQTAVDLARSLLAQGEGRLDSLSCLGSRQLTSTPGIGLAKATSILATFELARRLAAELPADELTIRASETVARMMAPHLRNLPHEECWVLFLNRGRKLIAKEKVSLGGMGSTVIDIKIIVKKAVDRLASGLILIHNHPSGNPQPGEQDRRQTTALKQAAAIFDIELVDHVIIGKNKYYSFSDELASAL